VWSELLSDRAMSHRKKREAIFAKLMNKLVRRDVRVRYTKNASLRAASQRTRTAKDKKQERLRWLPFALYVTADSNGGYRKVWKMSATAMFRPLASLKAFKAQQDKKRLRLMLGQWKRANISGTSSTTSSRTQWRSQPKILGRPKS